MGKTLFGGATHEGDIPLLTADQQQFLGGVLGTQGLSQNAGQSYNQFLQPYDPQQYQDVFNKSVVDPAMMNFNRQVLPAIQQRFVDANAGSSSALNQALAQGSADLTTSLGSQYGQFFQNQQQNQLNALGQLGGLSTQQTFQPLVSTSGGLAGPAVAATGMMAAGAMSSEKVKENIKDFKKIGLKDLKKFSVKQFDYIEEVGGYKDKIGLIAENIPKELTAEKNGILHVDLYALISVLINAVQEIDAKIEKLEAK